MKKYILLTGCDCDDGANYHIVTSLASLVHEPMSKVIEIDFDTRSITQMTEERAHEDPVYRRHMERTRALNRAYGRYLRGEQTYEQYLNRIGKK